MVRRHGPSGTPESSDSCVNYGNMHVFLGSKHGSRQILKRVCDAKKALVPLSNLFKIVQPRLKKTRDSKK